METEEGALYHRRKALEGVRTTTYEVSDTATLNAALMELGDYRRVVYPAQLCALPAPADT